MITNLAAYHRDYYRDKRRPSILEYVGGPDPKCAECGIREMLETDHIDPASKLFDIARNQTVNNPEVRAELDKCQLLCRGCHIEKTRAERKAAGFTHGSWYGWLNMRCRCDACDSARREHNANRRETRHVGHAVPGPTGKRYDHAPACGEFRMYRKGCRCDKCRAANAAKQKQYQARKAQLQATA